MLRESLVAAPTAAFKVSRTSDRNFVIPGIICCCESFEYRSTTDRVAKEVLEVSAKGQC